jgi:hypothetical protein
MKLYLYCLTTDTAHDDMKVTPIMSQALRCEIGADSSLIDYVGCDCKPFLYKFS